MSQFDDEKDCCCGGGHDDDCCCGGGCGDHDHGHEDEGCGSGCGGCCGGCGGGAPRDQLSYLVVGPIQTNCYVYVSCGECIVIDPGYSGAQIAEALEGIPVKYVVATHGHPDHLGGVAELVEATGAVFAMSAADANDEVYFGATNAALSSPVRPVPDMTVSEGDVIGVGTAGFRVMETPGHTPGGITLVGEGTATGLAFVGDTLFAGSCGRTDLPGGDAEVLAASLRRIAAELDPRTMVMTGHGDYTSMAAEVEENPCLR